MKYFRLILIAYALVLLVGCGGEIKMEGSMGKTDTAVPAIPLHIMKVYAHNGTLLATYTGKLQSCYDNGLCWMRTDRGEVTVKGIIIVEPYTP